jgi:hypothetical protein
VEAPAARVAQARAAEHPHIIPIPLPRIIGRAPVVATVASLLAHRRFVTVVGSGGIGKTTVAVATADHLCASYPHGVCFVDLASITDPLLMSGTVASALGLAIVSQDAMPKVVEFLKPKQMLIVLDNCEHVIEAAALLVEQLITGARGVHVIATSRESLRAGSEWVLRLAPLESPPPGVVLTAAEALGFSAIQLFAERATASLNTFELSDADVPIVAGVGLSPIMNTVPGRKRASICFSVFSDAAYRYPDTYEQFFGKDYQPPEYLRQAHVHARNHRWYMASRLITVNDIYSFEAGREIDPAFSLTSSDVIFDNPRRGWGSTDRTRRICGAP